MKNINKLIEGFSIAAVVSIIVCLLIVLFASSTEVKDYYDNAPAVTAVPAKPLRVVVQSFRTVYGLEKEMKDYIDYMVKQGYIVKSVAMMDDETYSKGIVVMEKY